GDKLLSTLIIGDSKISTQANTTILHNASDDNLINNGTDKTSNNQAIDDLTVELQSLMEANAKLQIECNNVLSLKDINDKLRLENDMIRLEITELQNHRLRRSLYLLSLGQYSHVV
ncbi:unnamed protein product, partial [Didymodactylos carnosus]